MTNTPPEYTFALTQVGREFAIKRRDTPFRVNVLGSHEPEQPAVGVIPGFGPKPADVSVETFDQWIMGAAGPSPEPLQALQNARLEARISALERSVRALERTMVVLTNSSDAVEAHLKDAPRSYSTAVTTLVSTGYALLHDVPVVVDEYDDEIAVTWLETEVTGLGTSIAEALGAFELALLDLFEDIVIDSTPDDLGPLPARWRVVLEAAVERTAGE